MSEERIDDPNLWKRKGDDYFQEGKYEEAIQYYTEAIDLDPAFSAAWNNLGFSYFKLERFEEAKKCKKEIIELKNKSQTQSVVVPSEVLTTPVESPLPTLYPSPQATPSTPPIQKSTGEGKNPVVAALLTLVIIGAGQWYNGEWLKGFGFLIGCVILGLIYLPIVVIAYFMAMVDAFAKANQLNKESAEEK
jgi:tetratricopeptide (TPR) repeat protein